MDRAAITQLSVRFHDDAEPVGGAQSSSPQPQPQTPPPPVQKASAKRARSLLGRRRGSMELVLGEADGRCEHDALSCVKDGHCRYPT